VDDFNFFFFEDVFSPLAEMVEDDNELLCLCFFVLFLDPSEADREGEDSESVETYAHNHISNETNLYERQQATSKLQENTKNLIRCNLFKYLLVSRANHSRLLIETDEC